MYEENDFRQSRECERSELVTLRTDNARLQAEVAEYKADLVLQLAEVANRCKRLDKILAQVQRWKAVVEAARAVHDVLCEFGSEETGQYCGEAVQWLGDALAALEVGK
jgi:phage host-nuclease inhibitor protein Gam